MKPKATLVSPVYNSLPYLRDYIASVEAQTWRPLQFIAVDDGSTDGSGDYLLSQKERLKAAGIEFDILLRPHENQAAAVSAALPLIRGEYFTWCDADDILTPDSIEQKVRYLESHPALDMVRSDALIITEGTAEPVRAAKEADRRAQNLFDALFCQDTYCFAGCYMMRTSLFFECFPEKRIPISPEGQNLQLLLPPASRTDCGFLPDALFHYYLRSGGHSSRKRSFTESMQRAENFAKLRAELLPRCRCDQKEYLQKNETRRAKERRQLLSDAAVRAREEMHK